jgi:hypothetical protein
MGRAMRQKNASMLGALIGNHIPCRAGSLNLAAVQSRWGMSASRLLQAQYRFSPIEDGLAV